MNEQLNNLIEALREELKQYGEMLALLDQEQQLVIERQAAGIAPCVAAINAQAETLQAVRRERDQRRRHLARTLQLCEDVSFRDLTGRLPVQYKPLLDALVDENKELLVRVQQRARQNHLLLSRMVELMQKLITSILPGTGPSTYSDSGVLQAPSLPSQPLYDAIG
ncbi:MAG TPA: flagellar export chaperone FlgN [Verrucomicrobiae bacterium]|nr:flagellar export chaperone FlgN [Verrucomicrobiae bacterium]